MKKMVSRQKHAIVFGFCLCLALAGCGRKPALKNLEPPSREPTSSVEVTPSSEVTIDGRNDGNQPVTVQPDNKGFILDFLL